MGDEIVVRANVTKARSKYSPLADWLRSLEVLFEFESDRQALRLAADVLDRLEDGA